MTSPFSGVLISPYSELLESPRGLSDHRGGPHWPDFEQQTTARHCRGGKPVDAAPDEVRSEPRMMGEMVAWGGPIVTHFGHQVADFSMRLLPTLEQHPGVPIAFSSHPRMGISSAEGVPPFVAGLWQWLGIPPDKVRVIAEPTIVRELVVVPQAEQLGGVGPSADHLRRLDALADQRSDGVDPIPAAYVSRASQRSRFAGEAYIEQSLMACAVTVIRPETLPLAQQLRTYAAAERLIFASGSAVHATQLLGRCLGDVQVLVRIPGLHIAKASVQPRARSLTYLEASAGLVHGFPPARPAPSPDPARLRKMALVTGMSVLDPERFVEGLASAIPDLPSRFDVKAFQMARDEDILRWLSSDLNPRWAAAREVVMESLRDAGVGHLVPQAGQILARC